METRGMGSVHASASLQAFQKLVAGGPPEAEALAGVLRELETDQLLEHALQHLKQLRPDHGQWGGALAQLKAAVAKSRTRRMSLWQVDPHRRTLRLRLEVRHPACAQHPPALLARLAKLLLEAGLPVAMGLEKNPRPALHLGHPLPLDVEGWREWADAVLREGPPVALEALPGLINRHAPAGLRILECTLVPNHASPVSELCRQAHWQWPCPEALLARARAGVEAFLAADRFEIEMPGKVEGHKGAKRVDLRPLLGQLQWDGGVLAFTTRIGSGLAPNPRKFLAGLLGLLPEAIQGLARTDIELRNDPRLLQEEKFTPKLHNMYEDAVLLDSGSHIQVVDDDDEIVILG